MKCNKVIITGELERSFALSRPLLKKGLETKIVSDDGKALIEEINRMKPGAVLLPAFMPFSDAVGVIRLAKTMRVGEHTLYFVVGSGEGLKTIHYIMSNGADYYFHMATKPETIAERIFLFLEGTERGGAAAEHDREGRPDDTAPEVLVKDFLRGVGISPHLKGFAYLDRALHIELASNKGPLPLTKQVYPAIAREFGTTELRVERDIRNAVAVAWSDSEKSGSVHDNVIFSKCSSKPSNREFLGLTLFELRRRLLNRSEAIG